IRHNFGKSHERQVPIMLDQRSTSRLHQVAAPKTDFGIRIDRTQLLNQSGAMQITRRFAGYNVVFHLRNREMVSSTKVDRTRPRAKYSFLRTTIIKNTRLAKRPIRKTVSIWPARSSFFSPAPTSGLTINAVNSNATKSGAATPRMIPRKIDF